jgi:glutamate 5-kinase
VLLRLARGEAIGTQLEAPLGRLSARKQWMADHLQIAGRLKLDEGAAIALASGGRSLLPIGVVSVEGSFARGDVVACIAPDGREIARGIVNYASGDARRIIGHASTEIAALLGFVEEPELIHRTNLLAL